MENCSSRVSSTLQSFPAPIPPAFPLFQQKLLYFNVARFQWDAIYFR